MITKILVDEDWMETQKTIMAETDTLFEMVLKFHEFISPHQSLLYHALWVIYGNKLRFCVVVTGKYPTDECIPVCSYLFKLYHQNQWQKWGHIDAIDSSMSFCERHPLPVQNQPTKVMNNSQKGARKQSHRRTDIQPLQERHSRTSTNLFHSEMSLNVTWIFSKDHPNICHLST